MSKSADNGLLFCSKENFGLGLTSIVDHFERMQVIKCSLLQNSIDPSVQTIYKNREIKNSNLTRTWRATKLLQVANAEVDLNLKFPGQNNKQGIGSGKFNPNPKAEQRRKLLTAKAFSFAEQKRILHSASLKRQGVWLKWSENTIPFDFSWKNLIWSSNSQIIKFVLSSSINWVKPQTSCNSGVLRIQASVNYVKMPKAHYTIFCRTALLHWTPKDTLGGTILYYSTLKQL